MATDTATQAQQVKKLRDAGKDWKSISLELGLSPSGKPAPKKAKKLYDQATNGTPVPAPKQRKTKAKASPPADDQRSTQDDTARPKRRRRSRAAQAQYGATLKQAEQALREGNGSDSVFDEDHTEDDITAHVQGHTIVVRRGVPGLEGHVTIDDYSVHRVTGYGISVQRGYRYVQFIDHEHKHRTVGVPEIVGIV